jgi:hypothetical protein
MLSMSKPWTPLEPAGPIEFFANRRIDEDIMMDQNPIAQGASSIVRRGITKTGILVAVKTINKAAMDYKREVDILRRCVGRQGIIALYSVYEESSCGAYAHARGTERRYWSAHSFLLCSPLGGRVVPGRRTVQLHDCARANE